jgi:alkanesulfonate monooxygenase SsuD/methylene tetrahydromethanopterin reductase-like flavin-dependent oxidoreductase (luciferase family)
MKLNVHVMDFSDPAFRGDVPGTLRSIARAADAGGWSTLTLMDHYFQMEQYASPRDPMLEGYTVLGFLAGQTERLQLGLLVTGVTYRHPGLLAKIVATLDVLSGGERCWGSGRPGTSGNTWALACPSLP